MHFTVSRSLLCLGFLFAALPAFSGDGAASPEPIIDAHLHTDFRGGVSTMSGIPRTREELFRQLREIGAIAAIGHTEKLGAINGDDLREQGVYHTLGLWVPFNIDEVEQKLRTGRYIGIKIYLGYQPFYASDDVFIPVYKLAEKLGLPVIFHTGDTASRTAKLKYSQPMTVDEVAVDFREVNFLIAHVGNPDMKAAANVVSKNENVFADSSGLLVGDLDHMAPETVNRLVVEPLKFFWDWVGDPNKLLFGTDWPLLNLPQWLALHKKIIPEKDQRKVFCENALTFFKLDPKELKPITGP